MSVIDDKRNIITQIGASTSILDGNSNIPDIESNLSSINNDNDIIPFLLDLLTIIKGSESLKQTVGEIFSNFIRDIESDLKDELKKQFIDFNSNEDLPTLFINNGYSIDATKVDIFNKLKNDPQSDIGNLLYGVNANTFDRKAYEALVLEGTEVNFEEISILYDKTLNTFTIKPIDTNKNIGEFIEKYIDSLDLFNETEFTSKLLDMFFGVLSKNENKTLSQIITEEKLRKTIEKIVKKEDDISITTSELNEIENTAKDKFLGINNLDVGCATLNTNFQFSALTNLINITTGSTDPLTIGNAYNDALFNSFSGNGITTSNNNEQPIKDGFFKKIISSIMPLILESITLTSQIRVLFSMTSGFKNNNVISLDDPLNDLQNNKKLIDCLFITIEKLLNEFIFDLIKKELLKLIIPISKLILKEKANQYVGIIKSLVNIV